MAARYFVLGSHACKTPGQPQSKVGKGMDGFYRYPKIGHYLSEEDARRIADQLQTRFPKGLFLVEMVPENFDGVSVPGL